MIGIVILVILGRKLLPVCRGRFAVKKVRHIFRTLLVFYFDKIIFYMSSVQQSGRKLQEYRDLPGLSLQQ